ncbi:unnamed protein product [Absidia cylindrospora]
MKLPFIHTLLNPPPSPPTCNNNNSNHMQPPTVQVLPASPTPSTVDNVTLSPMLSPALSSTRSPFVSSIDSVSPMAMNSSEFPPIHGDDPPRRLVHSSPSPQPRSPTHYLHHAHHHRAFSSHSEPSSPSYGYSSMKDHNIGASSPEANTLPTPPATYHPSPSAPSIVISQSSSSSSLSIPSAPTTAVGGHHDFLKPDQPSSRTRTNNIGSPSTSPSRSPSPSPSLAPTRQESVPAPPPCTQIFISPTGQPILKRRRGRPPTRSPGYDEGGWTFLSPTVWDVSSSSSQQQKHQQSQQQQQKSSSNQQRAMIDSDSTMTESMTAFTGADMDTVLPMPKKKRGRKPKTHIEGNSCFIWKDIGATRRSTTS